MRGGRQQSRATLQERAKTRLLLHRLTFELVRTAMSSEQASVVEETVRRVEDAYARAMELQAAYSGKWRRHSAGAFSP